MLDLLTTFSDAQDINHAAGTVLCSKSYDMGVPAVDALGNTVPSDPGLSHLIVDIRVVLAFTGTSGGTVTFQLISALDDGLTSSVTVLQSTDAIAFATCVAGYKPLLSRLPSGITQRFIGLQYVIATQTLTAGKVTAELTSNVVG